MDACMCVYEGHGVRVCVCVYTYLCHTHLIVSTLMCVRVHMRITVCVCVYVCIYITHLHIVEDTRNTRKQHTCKETHV